MPRSTKLAPSPRVQVRPAKPAPAGWAESLARSEAQIAAGKTVPVEPVLDRLRASIAGMKAKRAGTKAK